MMRTDLVVQGFKTYFTEKNLIEKKIKQATKITNILIEKSKPCCKVQDVWEKKKVRSLGEQVLLVYFVEESQILSSTLWSLWKFI